MSATGPSPAVVQQVVTRDAYRCGRCGNPVRGTRGFHWSIHHRQARGMGGSKNNAHINLASNLVVLCGHGTFGCHGDVERNRELAKFFGFIVPRPLLPADVAVHLRSAHYPDGHEVYLTDDGRYSDTPPEVTE